MADVEIALGDIHILAHRADIEVEQRHAQKIIGQPRADIIAGKIKAWVGAQAGLGKRRQIGGRKPDAPVEIDINLLKTIIAAGKRNGLVKRSEERRVGKECRSRMSTGQYK